MFFHSIKLSREQTEKTHLNSQSSEALFYYSVEFIKMILVIYKAHFTSQYQIVIISNSWKLFLFFLFSLRRSSRFGFNLCIWLSALFSLGCIFIANANDLVGKSCVIKFYFQPSREIMQRNATLEHGGCTRDEAKYKWQRILRIIKLRCNFYYPNLHFYCDDFFDWLFFLAVQLFPCEPTSGEEFLRSIISSPHVHAAFSFLSKRSKGER